MKKHLLSFILLSAVAASVSAQCTETYAGASTTPVTTGYVAGQSFTATCSGDINYVQFTAATSGTNTSGTLNIYAGNGTGTTPIYTQAVSAITVANVGDPIRVNIGSPVSVSNGSQYTFAFDVSLSLYASFSGYAGGDAFQSGTNVNPIDVDFEVDIIMGVGINEVATTDLEVYPNPAVDVLNISTMDQIENVTIYNISGALVKEAGKTKVIDIADLSKGMYIAAVQTDKEVSQIRFIKE